MVGQKATREVGQGHRRRAGLQGEEVLAQLLAALSFCEKMSSV